METFIKSKILLPDEQLDGKINCGFHQALNKTEKEYRQDFVNALTQAKILQAKVREKVDGFVSIIEPRIPFDKLISLQRLDIDPAVYYTPSCYPSAQPYAIWTEIFSSESFPESFRQLSPIEGIQINLEPALNTFFILALPGGEYENMIFSPAENRARILVLEHFLGKYRLGQIYRNELDSSVGVVGSWKGNIND